MKNVPRLQSRLGSKASKKSEESIIQLSLLPLQGGVRGGLGWGVFLLILFLASCGTKKQVTDSGNGASLAPVQNIVQTVNNNRYDKTHVTAKATLSLTSKDKNVSIGGTLRMKRDDVIQISLTTFGILEVARIEVTPDYFMAIDKMGRQYMKASFQDVSFLKTAGVDFHTLQALFWDELFLLDGSGKTPTEKQFTKTVEGDKVKLENTDSHLAVLNFLVNTATGLVQQTTVSPHKSGATPYFTWEYADFRQLESKNIPTQHIISIANGSKPIKATLSLSNLKNESGWETRTEISNSYKEISVEKLLSYIMKL